jgi:hypothetical protein
VGEYATTLLAFLGNRGVKVEGFDRANRLSAYSTAHAIADDFKRIQEHCLKLEIAVTGYKRREQWREKAKRKAAKKRRR